jgi:hypothetical protein
VTARVKLAGHRILGATGRDGAGRRRPTSIPGIAGSSLLRPRPGEMVGRGRARTRLLRIARSRARSVPCETIGSGRALLRPTRRIGRIRPRRPSALLEWSGARRRFPRPRGQVGTRRGRARPGRLGLTRSDRTRRRLRGLTRGDRTRRRL